MVFVCKGGLIYGIVFRCLVFRLDKYVLDLGRWGLWVLVIVLVSLLGMLDYWVGYEISISFFYLFPIGIATWYGNRWAGFFTALACVVIWNITDRASGQVLASELIYYWNMLVRFAGYSVVFLLLNELKLVIQVEHHLARTDYLTGILNGREFLKQLEIEAQRAKRLAYPVSLIYIDFDNFKQVNDQQGHGAGDKHLILVTKAISDVIRQFDLFARLGGDEFGLFLPNVGAKNARIVTAKIEKEVETKLREINSPITLSIGVVTYQAMPDRIDDMIQQADSLMYAAKGRGKNQAIYLAVPDNTDSLLIQKSPTEYSIEDF